MPKHMKAIHQGVAIRIEFDDQVYQPGPLTLTLCDLMEVRKGDRVIDVGCGTGYFGIMAALLGAAEVICIDPAPAAIQWTKHNARINHVANLLTLQGSELDPVLDRRADLIVTLPPQTPFPSNFNPARYGGKDGTQVLKKIIRQAGRILDRKGSRFYLVHAAIACPPKIHQALASSGFRWETVKTVEKELVPAEADSLTPGLTAYLLKLNSRGIAEIAERNGRHYYPVWFYRALLPGKTNEAQNSCLH